MKTFFQIFIALFMMVLTPAFGAKVPVLEASFETTPIPQGEEETDDAAIWLNPENPEKSLVLGVSKTKIKDGGHAGLGVYDLKGKEIQYFHYDRLNNVDIRHKIWGMDIAGASNRDKKAITLFSVSNKGVKFLTDIKLDSPEEPYGFCLQRTRDTLIGWLPMKSGLLHKVGIKKKGTELYKAFEQVIDTRKLLSASEDLHLTNIIIDDVIYEKSPYLTMEELRQELKEEVGERFQLEGCVSDDENKTLYLGMENMGVWKLSLKTKVEARLILKVAKAKSHPQHNIFPKGVPRTNNDIEGLSIYRKNNKLGALIVSVQGLNEYAVLRLSDDEYLGSFKVNFGNDKVTETDGLFISSAYLGENFVDGMMVLHDHHNTNDRGEILKANYKYVNMSDFLYHWPMFK